MLRPTKRAVTLSVAEVCAVLLFFSGNIFSQEDKINIREGNKLYEKGKFTEAEKSYQKSLDKNKNSFKGNFNLGDAYYKQGKFSDAANQFKIVADRTKDKDSLARIYHNMGNSFLQAKQYEESVNAYKNALKNNSKDEDTRYNLAYAMSMLKKQQQQQNKDDKKNQDKKENKDQKKQDQKKEQEKQKQEQEKNQMSKEDAKRMLEAMSNDEKKIQEKLKKQKAKAKVEIEKDW